MRKLFGQIYSATEPRKGSAISEAPSQNLTKITHSIRVWKFIWCSCNHCRSTHCDAPNKAWKHWCIYKMEAGELGIKGMHDHIYLDNDQSINAADKRCNRRSFQHVRCKIWEVIWISIKTKQTPTCCRELSQLTMKWSIQPTAKMLFPFMLNTLHSILF